MAQLRKRTVLLVTLWSIQCPSFNWLSDEANRLTESRIKARLVQNVGEPNSLTDSHISINQGYQHILQPEQP